MHEFANLVPASSHRLEPLTRDGSQFAFMLFHPRIDGGIAFDSTVESQQLRSHRRSAFRLSNALGCYRESKITRNPIGEHWPTFVTYFTSPEGILKNTSCSWNINFHNTIDIFSPHNWHQ
jgi:hypothetical protein